MFPLRYKKLIRGCDAHKRAGLDCAGDYVAAVGTPLFAPSDGAVVRRYGDPQKSQGGRWLDFRDARANTISLAHLNDYVAPAGQVSEGSLLAHTGNTGTVTTGPHLHLKVTLPSKEIIDPETYDWDYQEFKKEEEMKYKDQGEEESNQRYIARVLQIAGKDSYEDEQANHWEQVFIKEEKTPGEYAHEIYKNDVKLKLDDIQEDILKLESELKDVQQELEIVENSRNIFQGQLGNATVEIKNLKETLAETKDYYEGQIKELVGRETAKDVTWKLEKKQKSKLKPWLKKLIAWLNGDVRWPWGN